MDTTRPEIPQEEPKTVFDIPMANWPRFEKKWAAIQKTARKVGAPAPAYTVLQEDIQHVVKTKGEISGLETTRVWHSRQIRLEGETPKLPGGWQLAATLQFVEVDTGATEIILRGVPGIEIPIRYRTATRHCDYCKTDRKRIDTYLLISQTEEWTQIGSTCIKDFLGGTSPQYVAWMAEYFRLLGAMGDPDAEDWGGGGQQGEIGWSLLDFLTMVARVMCKDGWCSRKTARENGGGATVDTVLWLLGPPSLDSDYDRKRRVQYDGSPEEYQRDCARAEAALDYAHTVFDNGGAHPGSCDNRQCVQCNDYLYNLSVITRMPAITQRTAGLAASLIPWHEREKTRRAERTAAAASEYQGVVGQREEFVLRLISIREWAGDYGVTYFHLFRDVSGNNFIWKSSVYECREDIGKVHNIKGTVKAHQEYKGTKQTVLSRCKVLHVEGKEPHGPEEAPIYSGAGAPDVRP